METTQETVNITIDNIKCYAGRTQIGAVTMFGKDKDLDIDKISNTLKDFHVVSVELNPFKILELASIFHKAAIYLTTTIEQANFNEKHSKILYKNLPTEEQNKVRKTICGENVCGQADDSLDLHCPFSYIFGDGRSNPCKSFKVH